jgi:glycosyltransferase involved in cell wall biosynthesis
MNMKILFAPCHYVYASDGRSEIAVTFRIVNGLARKNAGSKAITGAFSSKDDNHPYEVIEAQPGRMAVNVHALGALIYCVRYFILTDRMLQRQQYDLVHHVLPFGVGATFNLSILTNRKFGTPFIIGPIQKPLNVQDGDLFSQGNKRLSYYFQKAVLQIARPIAAFLSTQTLKRADHLIAVNDSAKQLLVSKGVDPQKISIIPLGVDTALFNSGHRKPEKNLKLITVSQLTKRKGVDLILRALKIVLSKNINAHLTVVGDGPQMDNLKTIAKELGLLGHVRFVGSIPPSEVSKLHAEANIYVSMSKSEAFANVVLEAMSSGLAVVSSKVGGFEDVIEPGVNGYIVPQEDYDELAERLAQLAREPDKINRMGQAARKLMEDEFDWDAAIIPRYEEIYNGFNQRTRGE